MTFLIIVAAAVYLIGKSFSKNTANNGCYYVSKEMFDQLNKKNSFKIKGCHINRQIRDQLNKK